MLFLAECGLVDTEFTVTSDQTGVVLDSCVLRGGGKIVLFSLYGVHPTAHWRLKHSSQLFMLVVWGFLFECGASMQWGGVHVFLALIFNYKKI